ncbi:unnamed protein product [Sphacelaria rigidula]
MIPYLAVDEIEAGPKTGQDVYNSLLKNVWLDAMNKEIEGLERNNTWIVVDTLPVGEKAVDSKVGIPVEDGRIRLRILKQRLDWCSGGTSKRLTILQSFHQHLPTQQTEWLQHDLKEEVYMQLPSGLGKRCGTIIQLRKTLYDLPQAAREWFGKLGRTLGSLVFEQSLLVADPCIYRLVDGEELKVLIVTHVDDMFVMGDEAEGNKLATDLDLHFPKKNPEGLVLYPGCEYRHDLERGVLKLTQTAYVQRITEKISIDKTAATPSYVSSSFKVEEGEDYKGRYREAVGLLMWLSNNTRPDITNVVRAASGHNENPTPEDWRKVLRIFEYLNSTVDLDIT